MSDTNAENGVRKGKMMKGIAGFYYVHVPGEGIYECKAKGFFRKDGKKPLVGDEVELKCLDAERKLGNITALLPRKSELIRPAVANIDQALIVFAVTKPQPNYNLLDRFLIMMRSQGLKCLICFNKTDLTTEDEVAEIQKAYCDCGCDVFFTSVKEGMMPKELKERIAGKTTAIAGPSGVGKSSLMNALFGVTKMETGEILGVSYRTINRWAKACEKNGLDGLIPNFSGGKPSKLSEENKVQFKQILIECENLTMTDAQRILKDDFGIKFSLPHVCNIVRQLGFNYGKPRPKFREAPENGEEILKKTLILQK